MQQLTTIETLSRVAGAPTSCACRHEQPVAPGETIWSLLEQIANQRAEIERLRHLAGTDGLTGVANRRTFDDALAREVARAHRNRESCAVLMLDLDDLKVRNDTLGHASGDAAIEAVARICEEVVRQTDLVARLGGDEFAVLLSCTEFAGARALAERLRARLEQVAVDGVSLTVSVGVAALCGELQDGRDLMVAADASLYQDKRARKSARAPSGAATSRDTVAA